MNGQGRLGARRPAARVTRARTDAGPAPGRDVATGVVRIRREAARVLAVLPLERDR